ncbi:hypothetical protein LCGC14_2880180 [marine sediment metagenome]|uniref:Uncharacterized protein n=1 Tax=marine sediment metagenome TaxID=412755 RepID=A0A0F8YM28_9ZZZZ
MKYFVFRKRFDAGDKPFWEHCSELADLTKEELEYYLVSYSNDDYFVLYGQQKYFVPRKVVLI